MTPRYERALEYFCAERLNCYIEDLEVLPRVYSDLATSVDFNIEVEESDLHDIIFRLYRKVAYNMHEELENLCNRLETVEYVDNSDTLRSYRVEGKLAEDLQKIASEIYHAQPEINLEEESKFNSVLDNTIDFDSDLDTNVDYLVTYLLKNKLVRVEEEYKED